MKKRKKKRKSSLFLPPSRNCNRKWRQRERERERERERAQLVKGHPVERPRGLGFNPSLPSTLAPSELRDMYDVYIIERARKSGLDSRTQDVDACSS